MSLIDYNPDLQSGRVRYIFPRVAGEAPLTARLIYLWPLANRTGVFSVKCIFIVGFGYKIKIIFYLEGFTIQCTSTQYSAN